MYLLAASDDALSLGASPGADVDPDAVELGDIRERGGEAVGAGDDHTRHAIGAPAARGPAQAA